MSWLFLMCDVNIDGVLMKAKQHTVYIYISCVFGDLKVVMALNTSDLANLRALKFGTAKYANCQTVLAYKNTSSVGLGPFVQFPHCLTMKLSNLKH